MVCRLWRVANISEEDILADARHLQKDLAGLRKFPFSVGLVALLI